MAVRLAFGEFELDEARFELRRRGRAVAVQPKVLDLVFYLARHRDRVVSKQELLDRVWHGIAVTEASLSQAVSLARRALDDTAEEQHTIRTVRSKGLQFVAACPEAAAQAPKRFALEVTAPQQPPLAVRAVTKSETEQAEPETELLAEAPYLFAVLHGEAPGDGGASWCLADVDEVQLQRGSALRSHRKSGLTRLLTIAIPGRLLSRRHARLVRTRSDWIIVDNGSRNGTRVNEKSIDKRALVSGDLIECGRTIFRFTSEPLGHLSAPDLDAQTAGRTLLRTVTPRIAALDTDLRAIAHSPLSVLLIGESGVGKTYVARAVHALSARTGPFVTIEAATLTDDGELAGPSNVFERARSGTLLIENVDRLPEMVRARFTMALEAAADVRVISTALVTASDLARRLPADLLGRVSGFCCELPPLRERRGDIGVLVAALLESDAESQLELDVVAARALAQHAWPGNIRELEHVLKAARALCGVGPMRPSHLPAEMRGRSA